MGCKYAHQSFKGNSKKKKEPFPYSQGEVAPIQEPFPYSQGDVATIEDPKIQIISNSVKNLKNIKLTVTTILKTDILPLGIQTCQIQLYD